MRFFTVLLCLVLLTGCAAAQSETTAPVTTVPTMQSAETFVPPTTLPPDPVEELLCTMTTEEKVGQLFLARCDEKTALQDIQTYHLGGFILFGRDFEEENPDTLRRKLNRYQDAADISLLIAVDEEGGTVTRVSRYPAFSEESFPSPRDCYRAGGMEMALQNEENICTLLSSLQINVNLGPVCDITTDPNAFLYKRSLGEDPETTGEFVAKTVAIMQENAVGSALKHFPGYGNNADTHTGIAVDSRSLDQLEGYDLIPFDAGIQAGCGAIMVSHTIVEALDWEYPASLSPTVHSYLREVMNFQGVIITDDLVMQAITDRYGAGEAAVLAVLAGNDLLCSTEYPIQYEAVLTAVNDSRIDEATLNRAVRHVLKWKQSLELL